MPSSGLQVHGWCTPADLGKLCPSVVDEQHMQGMSLKVSNMIKNTQFETSPTCYNLATHAVVLAKAPQFKNLPRFRVETGPCRQLVTADSDAQKSSMLEK